MLESDVLLSKVNIIRRCLARIDETMNRAGASLSEFDTQDVVVLNLQRAIQACIDSANVVIAKRSLGLPANYKQSFGLLASAGLISTELRGTLERMVGFRNVAVHEYQELDPRILEHIVKNHLTDLAAFATLVHGWAMAGKTPD